MEVPKKILVDFGGKKSPDTNGAINGRRHQPAGYDSDSDEDDYDLSDEDSPQRIRMEPATKVMSPPEKLTLPEITDEERRRFMRDNSISEANMAYTGDDSLYKTPNDTVLKNMNSFQSGDPVSLARQIRHLHNRVKLLEEELQTQNNRQIFIFGILSVYFLSKGVRMMFR